MKYAVIKTHQQGDIIGEVVRNGLFNITIRNPIRVIDGFEKGKFTVAYGIYTSFVDSKEVKINKFGVVSINPLKESLHPFYTAIAGFTEKNVHHVIEKELMRFALTVAENGLELVARRTYLDKSEVEADTEIDARATSKRHLH